MHSALRLISAFTFVLVGFVNSTQARINTNQLPTKSSGPKQAISKTIGFDRGQPAVSQDTITIEPQRKIGYVIELVVGCPTSSDEPKKTGIIIFSTLDKSFCQPNRTCHSSAISAASSMCKVENRQVRVKLTTH